MSHSRPSRRAVLKSSVLAAGAAAGVSIVPAKVLGGPDHVAPSETFGGALIGVGGRGPGTYKELSKNLNVEQLALCDVKFKDKVDGKKIYTDFRHVLDRKDIDLVAIATPPHWHALISIAAAEAGKDVLCEKPMTRTMGEGRAIANAFKRYNRVFQIGTFGRFGMAGNEGNRQTRKLMTSGLLGKTDACVVRRGGFKVKEWSGRLDVADAPVPANLDWDLYCGPAPLKPFNPTRVGGTHRWYWDYENGGLGDMGQHFMDPLAWLYGLDTTFPVEVEASAAPAHPEVTGMWAWSKLTYANGFTLVLESGEWGEPSGLVSKTPKVTDLAEADQKKLAAMPEPEPLLTFADAVKQRKPAGGNAEAAYRTVAILHLTNLAIRTGRKLKFDPVTEQIVGDEEANRLINPPMRAPWHL
ncbi:MAG TPA: Gfo/Idh/MocA family oxidoreductase [Tepidisphaeraceae bacterium]|nr:Gfo/Idh/MocA family oxidoreductase [Tepidisphaeraceae bacterium]